MEQKNRELCLPSQSSSLQIEDDLSSEKASKNSDSDSDFRESRTIENEPSSPQLYDSQMRLDLSNLAQACDRTGVSDRKVALLVSSVFKDVGIVTKKQPCNIVDKNKIRRERVKCRESMKLKCIEDDDLHCAPRGIYFDGRKDKTLNQEKKGEKYYQNTIIEEHIVLISEPGSKYLGHTTPISGSSRNTKLSISEFCEKNELDLSQLVAVGCDGTAVNTGTKNGVIRQLEIYVGKPLHWFICLLHMNELPLRHLLLHLDGKTTGPKEFSGNIGKSLERCDKLPLVPFETLECRLTKVSVLDLSTDQKYLFEMCKGISEGIISSSLVQREPGKLCHSRWLTTDNRILRLYISTKNPSINLKILTEYIVKVYAPSWFEIKSKSDCSDGPKHLFGIIEKSRYLTDDLKAIIDPVLQTNGYFGHPENILLAMLNDNRDHIRELAIRRILKCRNDLEGLKRIREFKLPQLIFETRDYVNMINWKEENITEPPITSSLSHENLQRMIKNKCIPDHLQQFKFPCHTQAVECCIKLVTESSTVVCGEAARDGFIRSSIASRQSLPKFETKSQFLKILQ